LILQSPPYADGSDMIVVENKLKMLVIACFFVAMVVDFSLFICIFGAKPRDSADSDEVPRLAELKLNIKSFIISGMWMFMFNGGTKLFLACLA
jgi:hypothetical protein